MATVWKTLGVDRDGGIEALKQGLSVEQIDEFLARTKLPAESVFGVLGTTQSEVIARGRLSQSESERLWRVASVYISALSLFDDDATKALQWLESSVPALGGASPLKHAETEPGASEVQSLVWQLEHGVAA